MLLISNESNCRNHLILINSAEVEQAISKTQTLSFAIKLSIHGCWLNLLSEKWQNNERKCQIGDFLGIKMTHGPNKRSGDLKASLSCKPQTTLSRKDSAHKGFPFVMPWCKPSTIYLLFATQWGKYCDARVKSFFKSSINFLRIS